MDSILPLAQVVLAILLIGGILLQRSEAGLGGAFGQDSFGGIKTARRGAEKTVFAATIVVAVLFIVTAVIQLFLR